MKKAYLVFLVLFIAQSFSQAEEKVYIQVGDAAIKKSQLALPQPLFLGNPSSHTDHQAIAIELYGVISNDLDVSSYFSFIKPGAFSDSLKQDSLKASILDKQNGFDLKSWSSIGTEFLIKTGFAFIAGAVELSAYVYHVLTNKLIFAKKYQNNRSALRKLAHRFTNDVLENLTGQRGMFESRLVISSDRAGSKFKEIFIMDWDGANPKQITNHKSISISPTWSPDHQKVAYTSFAWHEKWKSRNADLFLLKLNSREPSKVLSSYRGINSGAAFTPSGDILLTVSKTKGTPDIYRIDQEGNSLEQLTEGPNNAMNVEPAVSPDGKKLAFSSDRSGRPMIYVMDLEEKPRKANRVVFAGWYNSTPTWSPDSKRIAFAGYDKDLKHFDVFLMNHDGHNLIRLTTAKKMLGDKYSNNEDPTFSPDGRHVIFISDRTGKKQVYMVNVDGSNERRLTFDNFNYFKPKWSSNLD